MDAQPSDRSADTDAAGGPGRNGALGRCSGPAIPAATGVADATLATDARPCRAADLAASWAGAEGAGGHTLVTVRFRNTSETPCVLKGYLHVFATEPGLPDVTGTEGSFFPVPGTANMRQGQVTFLGLESDTYCDARPDGGTSREAEDLLGYLTHRCWLGP